MDIKEKILRLEGKIALVVPEKDRKNSFLADVKKVDKTTDMVVFDFIGPPGENRRECWPIDKIGDAFLVEEEEIKDPREEAPW